MGFLGERKHLVDLCVEIKCQLDATEVFIADLIACSTCFGHHYAQYQELKIIIQVFIADLIACSTYFGHHYAHHQELKSIMRWLLPVVFGAVVFKLLVLYGAEGYVSGLQDAGARNMLSKK